MSPKKTNIYIAEQLKEMLGSYNRWLTGVKLGRSPSDEECCYYYIRDGGATDFAEKWKYQHEDCGV